MILELLAGYIGGNILFGGGTTVIQQRPLTEVEAKEKIRRERAWAKSQKLAAHKEAAWRKAHPKLAKQKDEARFKICYQSYH